MNITNNTSQIADTQALNRIFYNYALKSAQNVKNEPQIQDNDAKADDIKLAQQNNIFKGVDIDDIKKSAQSIGEDLSKEDIQYALTYGRSVIIDCSA